MSWNTHRTWWRPVDLRAAVTRLADCIVAAVHERKMCCAAFGLSALTGASVGVVVWRFTGNLSDIPLFGAPGMLLAESMLLAWLLAFKRLHRAFVQKHEAVRLWKRLRYAKLDRSRVTLATREANLFLERW